MAADDAGPLEIAWLCQGWRILVRDDWEWPTVFEPEDSPIAVLVMPAAWAGSRAGREAACGAAISMVFHGRYGEIMLMRGIRKWPYLAGLLATLDQDAAAD